MKSLPKHLKVIKEYKSPPIDWSKDKIISFSQYSSWLQCPYKWYKQYVEKIKDPYNMEIVFGNAIHSSIQNYLSIMYKTSAVEADKKNWNEFFEEALRKEYKKGLEQTKGVHFSTPEGIDEYYGDGEAIMDYFIKRRKTYFSSRKNHLIGIEFPISYYPHPKYPNIRFNGFIDSLIYNENTDSLYMYDFKTSFNGWKEETKKDPAKIFQLILYKLFFSQLFNWDADLIEIEFFIMKRKIWEESEFPIPRIQEFSPASGKNKRAEALRSLYNFIEDCFTEKGEYQNKEFEAKEGKYCKWCQFNKTCPKNVK